MNMSNNVETKKGETVMDGVQKLVKNELKEPLKKLGFKTRKFNFYRQVNGVVQGFKIYAYGHYTIRYNMFPLLSGVEYDNYVFEGEEIAALTKPERETFLYVIPWGADVTEEEQITAWENRYDRYKDFAKQLVNEVYTYLIPLFEEYSFCEKHFDKCEWKRLDSFSDITEWCLQARNFDLAYSNLEKAIIEEKSNTNPYPMQKMLFYKDYFDRNDMSGLEEYIREKERITLKSFGLK